MTRRESPHSLRRPFSSAPCSSPPQADMKQERRSSGTIQAKSSGSAPWSEAMPITNSPHTPRLARMAEPGHERAWGKKTNDTDPTRRERTLAICHRRKHIWTEDFTSSNHACYWGKPGLTHTVGNALRGMTRKPCSHSGAGPSLTAMSSLGPDVQRSPQNKYSCGKGQCSADKREGSYDARNLLTSEFSLPGRRRIFLRSVPGQPTPRHS